MKFAYIDALRGVAILAVIMINLDFDLQLCPSFFQELISAGERGVQLFFLISAFTLFLSYERRKQKEENVMMSFFIRRFFRLAPIYYLGIIYYLWQNGWENHFWLGENGVIEPIHVLSNFFFVNGLSPKWLNSIVPGGWSISAEMLFYLLVPYLFYQIKNLNGAVLFTVVTLIFAQGLKGIGYMYPPIDEIDLWVAYLNLYLPAQLSVFGCGFIAYFLIIKKEREISRISYLLIALIAIAQVIWGKIIPPNLCFGLVFLLFMVFLSKYPIKILVNKYFIFFGKISYSAYILHFAVVFWLSYFGVQDFIAQEITSFAIVNYFINLFVVLMITAPLSLLSFRLIETPMQKIGKQVIQRINSLIFPFFKSKGLNLKK